MDIETIRGEVIDHKTAIQILKTAVADLQSRITKLENENEDKNEDSSDHFRSPS